jgi:hypothetical protein
MERDDMQMGLIQTFIVPLGTAENAKLLSPLRTNNPLRHFAFVRHMLFSSTLMLFAVAALFAQTDESQATHDVGAGKVLVHSKFGGQIFGFDIDQNGTEGLLSESKTLADGNILAAVETFDQKTGKILKVVDKLESQDDFVTMGIVGSSVGLVEREHVEGGFVVKRIFHTLNPLELNKFNGSSTMTIVEISFRSCSPLTWLQIRLGLSSRSRTPTTLGVFLRRSHTIVRRTSRFWGEETDALAACR